MKVERLSNLIAALKSRMMGQPIVSVSVGYTQQYALFVHENLEAHHKQGKQAKFLEGPARQHKDEIAAKVVEKVKAGATLEQGLLVGGLYLQRLSMQVVPIDTGALRASAFTKIDDRG